MSDRKRGTSIRPLARVLDASDRPAWMIDAEGQLCYLSASCEGWLGVDIDQLLGRSTRSVPEQDSDLDRLARQLAAPLGLRERGQVHHQVRLPAHSLGTAALPVLFIALDSPSSQVLAISGHRPPPAMTADQTVALEILRELERWQSQLPRLAQLPSTMGPSSSAARLRRQLLLAATSDEHLLLIGPQGSGRESAALAIHRHRMDVRDRDLASEDRMSVANSPLVVVDGALMDAELLDATLSPVVHRLSESTTSTATVLLRNLEQMPHDAQDRLEQTCERFEGDLRLIALSTTDEASLRAAGQVTEALADRLSVYAIPFVALADRAVDIPDIAVAVLERRRNYGEGQAERFSRQTLDALVSYPWPLNLVELDAAVRHAVRTATGPAILPAHLPLAIRTYVPRDPGDGQPQATDLDQALQELERKLIAQALERAAGNRAEAARLLNISRGRLLRKLDESDAGGTQA